MFATQVLPEDTVDNTSENESEIVGYLVIEGKQYEIRKGENKIGRELSCSVVVDNCTISKLHAVIESDGKDETFIYDCGSTNLTKLGKKKLRPHCRYKLDDETEVILGNIIATFKSAPEINSPIKFGKTIPVNTQALDELDDIFDLPTQAPLQSSSGEEPRPQDNFKIPYPVVNIKPKPASSTNQDSGCKVLEDSNIFDLTTQCQIPDPHCDESDKVKSLLNDGQDDVLCNLMLLHSPKPVDPGIDVFDAPTQVDSKNEDFISSQTDESVLEVSFNEKEDFISTQTFEVIKAPETELYDVEKEMKDVDVIFSSDSEADESVREITVNDEKEDEILTQRFEEVTNNKEKEKEDDILTQKFEEVANDKEKEDEDEMPTQRFEEIVKETEKDKKEEENALDKSDMTQLGNTSQDLISTQIYEQDEIKLVEFSEKIESLLTNRFKNTVTKSVDDSGDETESDLEIDNGKSFTIGPVKTQPETKTEEMSHNSDDSYTFEVHPNAPNDDSDATDCEIEPQIKPEPVTFEETQVLTLTPPKGLEEIPTERRSPSPMCWSQLSLEMPSTQDVQTTMDTILEKQVGNRVTDSPLKRDRESTGSIDPSPAKKPKTVRGLSRLWQAHDIAQIQPTRTRTPRTPDTNKQSCRRSTRRKKSNPDITPYLIRCRTKKETPKENRPESARPVRRRKSAFETPKRRTKNDPPVIAFTGFESAALEKIIQELGGDKTNDLSTASAIVADKVRRTVKFLSAIGLGLPITSPKWLWTCKKEKKFLNPWDFILEDEEAEDKWEFDLRSSLERSKRSKLLEGYSVFATKSTKPPVKDLLAIVECCGGIPIVQRPTIWPRKTIIVSCKEDEGAWPPPKVRNIKLVHYEFILSGVLRQKIDFKSYNLR